MDADVKLASTTCFRRTAEHGLEKEFSDSFIGEDILARILDPFRRLSC
jgi:hypothetical protein